MDTKLLFALVAFALMVAAIVPYVLDTFKGKTKPHVYTWLIWTVTGGIATAAYIHGDGGYPAITSAIGTLFCVFVFLISFKYGTKNITVSDTIALIIAGLAIFMWVGLNNPLASVILGVSIDLIGYWPTIRKTYGEPWSEPLISWLLWTLIPLFSVLALNSYNIFTLLNPLPIAAINMAFILFFLIRRKSIPKPV
jgi:hypothetical protein